jgi:hypothetical protein
MRDDMSKDFTHFDVAISAKYGSARPVVNDASNTWHQQDHSCVVSDLVDCAPFDERIALTIARTINTIRKHSHHM